MQKNYWKNERERKRRLSAEKIKNLEEKHK